MKKMYVNGEWCIGSTGNETAIYNPANGDIIDTVTVASNEDVIRAIEY